MWLTDVTVCWNKLLNSFSEFILLNVRLLSSVRSLAQCATGCTLRGVRSLAQCATGCTLSGVRSLAQCATGCTQSGARSLAQCATGLLSSTEPEGSLGSRDDFIVYTNTHHCEWLELFFPTDRHWRNARDFCSFCNIVK